MVVDDSPDDVPGVIEVSGRTGRLLIGSQDVARSLQVLKQHDVSLVVNAAPHVVPCFFREDAIEYLSVNVCDTPSQDLLSEMDQIYPAIDRALDQGSGVLVHCNAGISRSSTICVAFLLLHHFNNSYNCDDNNKNNNSNNNNNGNMSTMSLSDALLAVRTARPVARPNSGFLLQLRALARAIGIDEYVSSETPSYVLGINGLISTLPKVLMNSRRKLATFCDASEIVPGVWLGGRKSVQNLVPLLERGITMVLPVARIALPWHKEHSFGPIIKVPTCHKLRDADDEDLLTTLPSLLSLMETEVNAGGNVLVCCAAGASRSAAVVAAYILSHQLDLVEQTQSATGDDPETGVNGVLDYMRLKRACVRPNTNFVRQLQLLYHRLGRRGGLW
ncbi:MAG: hypothetical protein MHM6MM_006773 [Cercozoa sp. M6MM]